MCSTLAAAHAATAASTMMAPCDRLSTPETPKINVKPVAPSAYNALMAKPSIRIWKASIRDGRGSTAAPLQENCNRENAPGLAREHDLWEGQFDVTLTKLGNFNWALATSFGQTATCLPSCHCSISPVIRPLPYFDRMGELVFLAVELDAADGADPVGLLQRIDQLVGIGRAGALDRVGDIIDLVIRGVAGIGREIAELGLEALQ